MTLTRPLSRLLPLLLLAITPCHALATACGGPDYTWDESSEAIEGTVESVWNALFLESAVIHDPGYENTQLADVIREPHALRLIGEKQSYLFTYDGTLRHRRADISFVTRPDSRRIDEADIYHELLIEGSFESLPNADGGPPASPRKATLVVQGLGNACLDGEAFRKWILVVEGSDLVIGGKVGLGKPVPARARE